MSQITVGYLKRVLVEMSVSEVLEVLKCAVEELPVRGEKDKEIIIEALVICQTRLEAIELGLPEIDL